MKQIAIGSDHAGFALKANVIKFLEENGWTVTDYGTDSEDSTDYPDYAHPVAIHVIDNECLGILICGSGNGVNMAANKHEDVRSALCWNVELAELARQHNNANILAIPARFVEESIALDMVKAFLGTDFEGGRHERRVNKINC